MFVSADNAGWSRVAFGVPVSLPCCLFLRCLLCIVAPKPGTGNWLLFLVVFLSAVAAKICLGIITRSTRSSLPSPVSLLLTSARGILKGKLGNSYLLLYTYVDFPLNFMKMFKRKANLKKSYNGHLPPRFYNNHCAVLNMTYLSISQSTHRSSLFLIMQRKRNYSHQYTLP